MTREQIEKEAKAYQSKLPFILYMGLSITIKMMDKGNEE